VTLQQEAVIGSWTSVSAATKQAACMLQMIVAPDTGSLGSWGFTYAIVLTYFVLNVIG